MSEPVPGDHPGVVAVIPAHDEEATIGRVVAGARRFVPVIVVDDGSSDETAACAAAAGADFVRQRPNQGKGSALRAGFRRALDAGADAVLTLDGDGQHDPDDIPRLLAAWAGANGASRPGLVVGRRDFRRMPASRRLANVLGGLALSAALGRRVPDNQSGYRLLGRRLAEACLASREAGFGFEVEMIARAIRLDDSIAWVPVRTIYAGETSHIRPWPHLRSFLRATLRARRIARGGRP